MKKSTTIFNFSNSLQFVFRNSCIYSHISVRNVIFPHLCQHLIILDMLIFVTLMSVKFYLTVFICLSLTIVSLNIFQVCVAHSCCLCEMPLYVFGLFSFGRFCLSFYFFVEFFQIFLIVKILSPFCCEYLTPAYNSPLFMNF